MILAVMSLQQWMSAHAVTEEGAGLSFEAMLAALNQIQHTQIKVLLLATKEDEPEKFIELASIYHGITNLDVEGRVSDTLLFIMQVADETEEDYIDAVRRAYPRIASVEAPRAIVSFTSLMQKIDEFTNFSFHNPGLDARHYHAWVASYVPIRPTQNTIVMSLGDVVQQDHRKAVAALVTLVSQQNVSADMAEIVPQIARLLTEQEEAPNGYIYQLKMRTMEESVFDERMVALIKQDMNVTLTVDEFNQIWQTSNPDFGRVSSILSKFDAQAIHRARYDFEFVSFTNPKDMHHWLKELQRHDQDYVVVNGELVGFAGLRLSCSYIEQKSTLEMIKAVVAAETYPESFLAAKTPQKSRDSHHVYFVSARKDSNPELDIIGELPGVTVLLGWDGSPVQAWVETQRALELAAIAPMARQLATTNF